MNLNKQRASMGVGKTMIRCAAVAMLLWIGAAVIAVNCIPTQLPLVISHGFYDYATAINGWPVVFRVGTRSTPNEDSGLPEFPETSGTTWLSAVALLADAVIGLGITVGTLAVCAHIARGVSNQMFFWPDLLWTVVATGIGVGIAVYCAQTPGLFGLLGADLERPRLGVFAWYSSWTHPALGIGSAFATLVLLRRLIPVVSFGLRRPRPMHA